MESSCGVYVKPHGCIVCGRVEWHMKVLFMKGGRECQCLVYRRVECIFHVVCLGRNVRVVQVRGHVSILCMGGEEYVSDSCVCGRVNRHIRVLCMGGNVSFLC